MTDFREKTSLATRIGGFSSTLLAMACFAAPAAALGAKPDAPAILDELAKKHGIAPPTRTQLVNQSDVGLEYAFSEDHPTHMAVTGRGVVNLPLMLDVDSILFTVSRLPTTRDANEDPGKIACSDKIADRIVADVENGSFDGDQFFLSDNFFNHDLIKNGSNYVFKSPLKDRPSWVCNPETLTIVFVPGKNDN